MSCPSFQYTPRGRQGIGVIQPESGLDYPFVDPSPDIQYMLADFYLAFDDPGEYSGTPAVLPLRIKYLYNVGCDINFLAPGQPAPANAADIVVVDAANIDVFNTFTTSAVLTVQDWGADYKLYEWRTSTGICRLVAYTTWKPGSPDARNYWRYLLPVNGVLDNRAVYKMPKRLKTVSVRQRNGDLVLGPYDGRLKFRNNYNTEIVAANPTTTNFIKNTSLTFSAVAGSGAGYFPVCGQGYDAETGARLPQPIRQINGVQANAYGDFLLSGADCLFVRRKTSNGSPSATSHQHIGGDCTPCCKCDDYVDMAEFMNKVRDKYRKLGDRVTRIKHIHEDNIAKWKAKRSCSLGTPLKLVMLPQCCPKFDVLIMFCNPCDKCTPPSTLTLNLTSAGMLSPICGETLLRAPGGNTNQPAVAYTDSDASLLTATIQFPMVPAGSSTYIQMKFKDKLKTPHAIEGTLSGVFDDGTPIMSGCPGDGTRTAVTVTKTITLNCDPTGENNRPC